MKRFLSILLCISLLTPCLCIIINAEEEHTFYKIGIDAGSGVIYEKAVVKDGEIYIPAESFSNYTRFFFDAENKMFLIKGQQFKKASKSVGVEVTQKKLIHRDNSSTELSDCFEVKGVLYLPFCQMLPILNADIFEIKNDVIYISNNKISLAEIIYDSNINDLCFDINKEFYDNSWLSMLTVVPSYVFDTVVNVRFDRLDVIYNSGDYEDYVEIFSEFLKENDLYLKARAEDKSALHRMVEGLDFANDFFENSKSVFDWVEAAGETHVSFETAGALLDLLDTYYNSKLFEFSILRRVTEGWTKDTVSVEDYVDLISYIYSYATLVEDNHEMLNAVYDLDSKITKKETARKAAKHVYTLYGEDIAPAVLEETTKTLTEKGLEFINPYKLYTSTAKLSGKLISSLMPYTPGDVARLPLYSEIVLSAAQANDLDMSTDESVERLRQANLLCMIASKKCYEIMKDIFEKDSSYYDLRIEKIEAYIMALYMAKENTVFDSCEHYDEFCKSNLEKVKKSGLLDEKNKLPDMQWYNYIPAEMVLKYETMEEYYPSVKFNKDFTCHLKFNYLEGMYEGDGRYQVMINQAGRRVIKIEIDNNDTFLFYLVEEGEGRWKYYGHSSGITRSGAIYESVGDESLEIMNVTKVSEDADIVGRYILPGGTCDKLDIEEVSANGDVKFNAFWYRLNEISDASAWLFGNLVFFEDRFTETIGMLDLTEKGKLKMYLFVNDLSHVDDEYTYVYVSDEEYNRLLDLENLNDLISKDSPDNYNKGWQRASERIPDLFDPYYLIFYENGTVSCWKGVDHQESISFSETKCNYRLDGQILYINDCAYDIIFDSAWIFLQARGVYEMDFSGDYIMRTDDIIEALN